jgi:hypothetical protein
MTPALVLFAVVVAMVLSCCASAEDKWENACEIMEMEGIPRESSASLSLNMMTGVPAEKLVGSPVYISLATISSRISIVHKTILSILNGTVVPTHVYLFISREPFLIDQGIPLDAIPEELSMLCSSYPVSIIYTKNIGPHRKLLPLLKREKRNKNDVVIVSGDDDRQYPQQFLLNLVTYYLASNKAAVISYRARRVALCQHFPHRPVEYGKIHA